MPTLSKDAYCRRTLQSASNAVLLIKTCLKISKSKQAPPHNPRKPHKSSTNRSVMTITLLQEMSLPFSGIGSCKRRHRSSLYSTLQNAYKAPSRMEPIKLWFFNFAQSMAIGANKKAFVQRRGLNALDQVLQSTMPYPPRPHLRLQRMTETPIRPMAWVSFERPIRKSLSPSFKLRVLSDFDCCRGTRKILVCSQFILIERYSLFSRRRASLLWEFRGLCTNTWQSPIHQSENPCIPQKGNGKSQQNDLQQCPVRPGNHEEQRSSTTREALPENKTKGYIGI